MRASPVTPCTSAATSSPKRAAISANVTFVSTTSCSSPAATTRSEQPASRSSRATSSECLMNGSPSLSRRWSAWQRTTNARARAARSSDGEDTTLPSRPPAVRCRVPSAVAGSMQFRSAPSSGTRAACPLYITVTPTHRNGCDRVAPPESPPRPLPVHALHDVRHRDLLHVRALGLRGSRLALRRRRVREDLVGHVEDLVHDLRGEGVQHLARGAQAGVDLRRPRAHPLADEVGCLAGADRRKVVV